MDNHKYVPDRFPIGEPEPFCLSIVIFNFLSSLSWVIPFKSRAGTIISSVKGISVSFR